MLFEVNILDKVQNIAPVETDTCIIINAVARKNQIRIIYQYLF